MTAMAAPRGTHSKIWVILALLAALLSIALQLLYMKYIVFSNDYGMPNTTDLFQVFPTELTPKKWTLDASMAFFLQIGWIAHVLINMVRTSKDGTGPFYKDPRIVSALFLLCYVIGVVFNMLVLVLSNLGFKEVTIFLWIIVWLAFTIAMADYYHRIHRNVKRMAEEHRGDLLLFRIFLQNGLTLYISWCMISTLLNLTIILQYSFGFEKSAACLSVLVKLAIEILVFLILDLWYFERYTRYTFTPYLVIIWAMSGAIAAHWDPAKAHSIVTVLVLMEGVLGLLMKIMVTIIKSSKQPLYESM